MSLGLDVYFTMKSAGARSPGYISPAIVDGLRMRQSHSAVCSLGMRKKQLIAVGIVDLEHVVAPPRFLTGNRALDDFTAKLRKPVQGQLNEQPRPVFTRGVLAEDDLAFSAIDLADLARAVAFMPTLLEAEHVDVETKRPVHLDDAEHR